jgi:hypothetical protein
LDVCGANDCTPTLLLLLHSWGGGMQQLWFNADLSPLLSLPSDVNVLFATSLDGADVITDHMLGRLASLQHTGSILHWLYSLFGASRAAPAARVIQQQLSLQHRDTAPFLCVPRPSPRRA